MLLFAWNDTHLENAFGENSVKMLDIAANTGMYSRSDLFVRIFCRAFG